MKKVLYSIAIAAIMISGCKKDDPKDNGGATGGSQTAPESYTQKMMVEYFSGTWCGWCPRGVSGAKAIHASYPNNFTYIVAHKGSSFPDPMETTETGALAVKYNAGFPTGMVNRTGAKGVDVNDWAATAATVNAKTPTCGLAIDATDASKIKVKLGIGKTDLAPGKYKIHVYGVAKSVIRGGARWTTETWDQTNYLYQDSRFSNLPYYSMGDYSLPTNNGGKVWFIENKNYPHEQVLADILTADFDGQEITEATALKAGAITTFEFALNRGQYDTEDFQIIAFISNADLSTKTINVQYVDLGKAISFD